MESSWTPEELAGRAIGRLVPAPSELDGRDDRSEPFVLRPEAAEALLALRAEAAREGIDLKVISGYRSFARQRSIWNRKVSGELPLRNRAGEIVSPADYSPAELLEALSVWSALPGASRHHWGTDVDVIDAAARPAGYDVRLVPEEYAPGGPFALLGAWLDSTVGDGTPFARPYFADEGKERGSAACPVAPEPWHLSCRSAAEGAQRAFSAEVLAGILRSLPAGEEVALADRVLADPEGYFDRWIRSAFVR